MRYITRNPLIATDAYKPSHYLQIPKETERVKFYMAPRKKLFKEAEFFLQGIVYSIVEYLRTALTEEDLDDAINKLYAHFGIGGAEYPFNKEGARKILTHCNGYLPVTIKALPEGKPFTRYNIPVLLVEANHKDFVWVAGFIETFLQRGVWYPSTVGTASRSVRKYLKGLYDLAVMEDQHWTLDYRLHDFGARGASSGETAAIGGAAHLINFNGTDTMEAVWFIHKFYGTPVDKIGCSIPAAEHFTVTIHPSEIKALKNMINVFGKQPMFAFVSDSYDYKKLIDTVWSDPEIIAEIKATGTIPVVRPDSGDPNEMVMYALNKLAETWGYTTNEKGFKVLNGIRIIQGDGMDLGKIKKLYDELIENKFSPENLAVGMGGGLLQKFNRDDMSWSMKCYRAFVDGDWITLQKNPKTDPTKKAWNPDENAINQADYIVYYHMEPGMQKPEMIEPTPEYFEQVRAYARAGL